jgi:hypothetical protein
MQSSNCNLLTQKYPNTNANCILSQKHIAVKKIIVSVPGLRRVMGLTLNDGEKDDDDEEEEADVEEDAVDLVRVAVRRFDLVTDAAAGADALVQVEHEALQAGIRRCHFEFGDVIRFSMT